VAGRPCFGPCDPSVFDWIGYGALLVGAAAVVALAYLVARRLLAHRGSSSRAASIVVIGIAIVLAAIVVPRYPRPTFVPVGIDAGTDGSGATDTLYLEGSYAVSWTLEPRQGSSCQFEAALYRAADRGFIAELAAPTTALSGQTGGIEALAGGGYFIEATSECRWRVMLDPRTVP